MLSSRPGVAVGVGVGGGPPVTWTQPENSDVFPFGSVAVAVTTAPPATITGKVTVMLAVQVPLVVTIAKPRKVCPSPLPDESHAALEKNSILNVVLAVLLRLPSMVVLPPPELAEVKVGKFWKLLGPVSPSQESLGVTPLGGKPVYRQCHPLKLDLLELARAWD